MIEELPTLLKSVHTKYAAFEEVKKQDLERESRANELAEKAKQEQLMEQNKKSTSSSKSVGLQEGFAKFEQKWQKSLFLTPEWSRLASKQPKTSENGPKLT